MYRVFVSVLKRAVFTVVLVSLYFAASADLSAPALGSSASVDMADTSGRVTLQIRDTTVSPHDSLFAIPVYLKLEGRQLGAVDIRFIMGRPDLVAPVESVDVDTQINCVDPLNCDTTLDTTTYLPLDFQGSLLQPWTPSTLALMQNPWFYRYVELKGISAPAIEPSDNERFLFRIWMRPLVTPDVLDTLQDRSVQWFPGLCTFSTPEGTTIGRRDSVICLNPPSCDSLDTLYFNDNVYLSGTLTIGPSCLTGDLNRDLAVTASDVIALVNYVFKGGPEPPCGGAAGDADCSGLITAADIIQMVNYIFKSGPPPCAAP